ncbi:ATP-binding cassette domain-containing protein [candidate division KSB1 bacterium]|nr:ATP-binding cassette domain-containing protein [candidate division KSB1 bacterium]NIR73185.1 ATP-binding cassette domain-containing protein [candidate division KSB1 bacterium]NIS28334.1 ATP-binding cassette domain-containing protein [candidate division KSB1 bacterium]NIT75226.1 ATP-binding cassette domain-containing protein [candidate division KSB1 bacterium]NIU29066.1 ATP-binding cassette domain-containing protein [candidate division KSB1 bacterium]
MIEVHNLRKEFKLTRQQKKELGTESKNGKVEAVAGISFTCKPGRIFSLLGPNGAGKTTTLRMIATMLQPTSGSIKVGGYDTVTQAQQVRRRLGFLTGTTRLYDRLTPDELVKYYADLHEMDKDAFKKRRDEIFTRLEMHEFAGRRIAKLSSGMRQKVSIARTIVHDPQIVVFDEPTASLDVITARNILDLIRSFRDSGKTVIFSTHIMGEVSLLSDDLAIIHEGKLCYNGSYQDFVNNMKSKSLEDEFVRLTEEV